MVVLRLLHDHLHRCLRKGVFVNSLLSPSVTRTLESWLSKKHIVWCLDNLKHFENEFHFLCLLYVRTQDDSEPPGHVVRTEAFGVSPIRNKSKETEIRIKLTLLEYTYSVKSHLIQRVT